jgi:hypothetical protein
MKTKPYLNYRACTSEAEAEAFANQLIGGGIIQLQDDGLWHVFGAREFAERVANGEPV